MIVFALILLFFAAVFAYAGLLEAWQWLTDVPGAEDATASLILLGIALALAAYAVRVFILRQRAIEKRKAQAADPNAAAIDSFTARAWAPLSGFPSLQWQHIEPHQPYHSKIHNAGSLSIRTHRQRQMNFHVAAETEIDRWAKRVGLAKEQQVGDAALDHNVYFAGQLSEEMRQALVSVTSKSAIHVLLFQLKFRAIEVDSSGQLSAILQPYDRKPSSDQGVISQAANALMALDQMLPAQGPALVERTQFKSRVLSVGACLFGTTHLLGWPYPLAGWGPALWYALLPGGLLWLGFNSLCRWYLRGGSSSVAAYFQCALIGAIMLPIGSYGLVLSSNGMFDQSEAITGSWPIIKKHDTRGGSCSVYIMIPGTDQEAEIRLSIKCNAIDQTHIQGIYRQGYWGLPWWQSAELM
jgi:hypothetical protein